MRKTQINAGKDARTTVGRNFPRHLGKLTYETSPACPPVTTRNRIRKAVACKYLNDASAISKVVRYVGARECSYVRNVLVRGRASERASGAVASRSNAMGSICGIDYTMGRPVCICVTYANARER